MTRRSVLFRDRKVAYDAAVGFLMLNDKFPDLDFCEPVPKLELVPGLELGAPVGVATSNIRVLSKYAEKVRAATVAATRAEALNFHFLV